MTDAEVYKKAERIRPLVDGSILVYYAGEPPRRFDVTPYFERGIFRALQDSSYFRRVRLDRFAGIT